MYERIFDEISNIKTKYEKKFNNYRLDLMKSEDVGIAEVKKKNKKLFEWLKKSDRQFFLLLLAYLAQQNIDTDNFNLDKFLEDYNATLGYVYNNEAERKENRYSEAFIAYVLSQDSIVDALNGQEATKTQQTNARQWVKQLEEISVDLERNATIEYWIEQGIKKVKWIAAKDERMCETCGALDGNIYEIAKVPPRPHINCRCLLEPYTEREG